MILESIAQIFGDPARVAAPGRGNEQYGDAGVNQLEHALQCATLAQAAGASRALVTACLLHDLGHLLHDLDYAADSAPQPSAEPFGLSSGRKLRSKPLRDRGLDDRHEYRAKMFLSEHFDSAITEPIRLHVDAKRYLCAVDRSYWATLSDGSQQTLKLQGGVFSDDEAAAFIAQPHAEAAVQLRQWDDRAKVVGLETPDLHYFLAIAVSQ